jgi:hypothetical protein
MEETETHIIHKHFSFVWICPVGMFSINTKQSWLEDWLFSGEGKEPPQVWLCAKSQSQTKFLDMSLFAEYFLTRVYLLCF